MNHPSSAAFILCLAAAWPATSLAQTPEAPRVSSAPPAAATAAEATVDELIDTELGTPGGLTADEVARRAVGTSPSVAGRGAELSAASAGLDRATTCPRRR
jgi:hypothetical protein